MCRYRITSAGRLIDSAQHDLEPDGYIMFYTEDGDDRVRYGLASFRWFEPRSFLFGDPDEVANHGTDGAGLGK